MDQLMREDSLTSLLIGGGEDFRIKINWGMGVGFY